MPATCVLIRGDTIAEVEVDDSPMSPYAHTVLGGRPSFCGAWNDCEIVMLKLETPPHDADPIPPHLLPTHNCETDIVGPVLVTKLDEEYTPIHFTVEDYNMLLESSAQ
jgi:hypothetical protein